MTYRIDAAILSPRVAVVYRVAVTTQPTRCPPRRDGGVGIGLGKPRTCTYCTLPICLHMGDGAAVTTSFSIRATASECMSTICTRFVHDFEQPHTRAFNAGKRCLAQRLTAPPIL